MKIDAAAVKAAFLNCLFRDEEIVDGKPPANAVPVKAVTMNVGFHPERLAAQRDVVMRWLNCLPSQFRQHGGGGWSFLNACVDIDGNQWGEHRDIEHLLALGLGLNLVAFLAPREMWEVLPGGMPYFVIKA